MESIATVLTFELIQDESKSRTHRGKLQGVVPRSVVEGEPWLSLAADQPFAGLAEIACVAACAPLSQRGLTTQHPASWFGFGELPLKRMLSLLDICSFWT